MFVAFLYSLSIYRWSPMHYRLPSQMVMELFKDRFSSQPIAPLLPMRSQSDEEPDEHETRQLRRYLKFYFYRAFKWKDNTCSIHLAFFLCFLVEVGKLTCVTHQVRFNPFITWASQRANLSLGFLTKQVSNQSPQLHRLARNLKFHL